MENNIPSVFDRQGEATFDQLFLVCREVLSNYLSNKEKLQWINNVEPGRLLDVLRLYIGLIPEAKLLIGSKRYRSEHATLMTRWLKLHGNKSSKIISSQAIKSVKSFLRDRTPSEIVASIKDGDVKSINMEANDVFRYVSFTSFYVIVA